MIPVLPVSAFGSVGYFSTLAQHEQVAIDIWEHFPRRTLRNRYEILSPQGRMTLTIPVEKPNGSKTFTKDVLIAEQGNWRTDHVRSLQACYRSSPYFEHYESEIEQLLLHDSTGLLVDYALRSNTWLLSQFGVDTEFVKSDEFQHGFSPLFTDCLTYSQVFFGQAEFAKNLSVLDILFNLGPDGRKLLVKKM